MEELEKRVKAIEEQLTSYKAVTDHLARQLKALGAVPVQEVGDSE